MPCGSQSLLQGCTPHAPPSPDRQGQVNEEPALSARPTPPLDLVSDLEREPTGLCGCPLHFQVALAVWGLCSRAAKVPLVAAQAASFSRQCPGEYGPTESLCECIKFIIQKLETDISQACFHRLKITNIRSPHPQQQHIFSSNYGFLRYHHKEEHISLGHISTVKHRGCMGM